MDVWGEQIAWHTVSSVGNTTGKRSVATPPNCHLPLVVFFTFTSNFRTTFILFDERFYKLEEAFVFRPLVIHDLELIRTISQSTSTK